MLSRPSSELWKKKSCPLWLTSCKYSNLNNCHLFGNFWGSRLHLNRQDDLSIFTEVLFRYLVCYSISLIILRFPLLLFSLLSLCLAHIHLASSTPLSPTHKVLKKLVKIMSDSNGLHQLRTKYTAKCVHNTLSLLQYVQRTLGALKQ